ncbi:lytic transglycosylase domain-containing protein [Neptunomonas antarctica]|uniref:Transglycosylase SLT domain-containing protein n=1 Tax=Neptunomonas antarctica TaxID=619304 RepID=A0A1N7KM81_9GAMM|nr:lytic transglycosylase domain-containing protein [Neptunomonas antarctica]SIS62540.1 Transglycosylase SLT domain-containing protein [Neptunomonas antarctica]
MIKEIISIVLVGGLLSSSGSVFAADGIRRIVRADGVIEYTNVSNKASSAQSGNALRSGKKKTYESIYKYRESNGVLTFSDQKPRGGIEFQTLKFACFACNPTSTINWNNTPLNLTAYEDYVSQSAKQHAVDPALIRAVMHAESAFNPAAVSSQGAQGLMQLMPATARELGVSDALNAAENIQGGVKYLGELLGMYHGDILRATAAYNAGPGAVKKYNGVPPYAETKAYVERVGILHKRYQEAGY